MLKSLAKTPVVGSVLLILYRARVASGYFWKPLAQLLKWLFTSKEITNFTYDLENHNRRYLASLIADLTGKPFNMILGYFEELEEDFELQTHISTMTQKSDLALIADRQVRFGRRIGWYALVRAIKPKVVIETGVDKGLGACVLTAAIKKNQDEGHTGAYLGTDINPAAGYLLTGEYANYGQILYGDSIETLKSLDVEIDLFINDSDHSAAYEAEEYATIAGKLTGNAILLGDNSHCTDCLLNFSLQNQRQFIFFQEKPANHWYPGAGIGFSFQR